MAAIIGFATEYYTLWDLTVEPVYQTDAYGKHWHVSNKTNYWYQKNISKDLEKVKALYPGVAIDDELRGKTRSFSIGGGDYELSPVNILWFGKYRGHDLNELAKTDLPYVMWLLNNANDGKVRAYVATLPEVKAELDRLSMELESFFSNIPTIKESGVVEIAIRSNPRERVIYDDKTDTEGPVVYAMEGTIGDGSFVYVIPHDVKYMAGSYSYPEWYAPVIDGKSKRLKGKTIKANVELIHTSRQESGWNKGVHQYVKIISLVNQ